MGGTPEGASRKALWKQVVETLRRAADYAAARHVAIAVDGIWPVWLVDSPDALQQLFDDVDHQGIGVNLDPSYLTLMGVAPAKFVDRFHKQIVHAHLKDHDGAYPKWTHHIPGEGDMDYAPVLAALRRRNFDGSLSVECFTNMKFEEACDTGFAAMTKAAKEARVGVCQIGCSCTQTRKSSALPAISAAYFSRIGVITSADELIDFAAGIGQCSASCPASTSCRLARTPGRIATGRSDRWAGRAP